MGGLPFSIQLPVPNGVTLKAMSDAENGTDLHCYEDAEEMFKALYIL